MAATVGIRFQGDDFVSPTVKNIHNEITGMATSAKSSILTGFGMGAGIAAFGLVKQAVGAVLGPLGDAWQLSKDTQVAQTLLNQALKNNIPNFYGNADGANSFALAQGKLGFQSNDVRNALAQLVGVTHNVSDAEKDVSLAEDLARSKGIDLATATDIVTKAHEGNGKALKALGIDIKGAKTAAELLAAVQKNVTQTAEQWANTSEGHAAQAQVKLTEMMVKLGDVIDHVAQTVIPIAADAVNFLIDNFTKFLPAIIAVAGGITVMLIPAMVGAAIAAWALVAPLLPIIAALGLLAGAAMLFTMQIDKQTQSVVAAHTEMSHWGGIVKQTATDVVAVVDQGFSKLPVIVERGVEASRKALADAAPGMAVAASQMANPVSKALSAEAQKALSIARGIPGDVANALVQGQKDVESGMKTLTDLMTDKWTDASRIAYYKGILTSGELARGLRSGDADVRSQAEYVKANALTQLELLQSGAADIAARTGVTLADGLTQALVPVATAAAGLRLRAIKELDLTPDLSTGGYNAGTAWIAALAASVDYHRYLVLNALARLKASMAGFSPPKEGPLKDIDKGGFNVGKAWMMGLAKGMGGGLSLPKIPGMSGGGMGSGGGGGMGQTININIAQGAFIDGPSVDKLATLITQRLRYAAGT
jgi:hypothetical protein